MMAARSLSLGLGQVDDDVPRVKDAREVVKSIVDLLQERFYECTGKNLAEVVTSGSLGQGTTVPGNFDADLILLSKDITPELMADTDGAARDLVAVLKRIIEESLDGLGPEGVQESVTKRFIILRFVVEKPGKPKIDVDLAMGPHWEDIYEANDNIMIFKQQHLQEWKECKRLLLPSIGKWQMEFIVDQPDRVKELIRRVKKWQKEQWPDSDSGKPSSYLLAILIVTACKKWCKNNRKKFGKDLGATWSPSQAERASFEREVQEIFEDLVINHHSLSLDNLEYQRWFSRATSGDSKARYTQVEMDKPAFILDPACVYHNLYRAAIKPCRGSDYNPLEHNSWGVFARNIKDGTLDLTKSVFDLQ